MLKRSVPIVAVPADPIRQTPSPAADAFPEHDSISAAIAAITTADNTAGDAYARRIDAELRVVGVVVVPGSSGVRRVPLRRCAGRRRRMPLRHAPFLTLTLAVVLALIAFGSMALAVTASNGLIYSTASAHIVQRQPRVGTCHAIGTGLYTRPDPHCTPGALNPAVTQATIGSTICRRGWTSTVRPSESITEPEKFASMDAYGITGSASRYEYDHDVPLELGGAVNDPRNLWPEPGDSPNPKDALEDRLRSLVCDGTLTLAVARQEIATDWVSAYRRLIR